MNQQLKPIEGENKSFVVINGIQFDPESILDKTILASVDKLHEKFRNNQPFPHLVIENLFPPALLELMYEEFDTLKYRDWRIYDSRDERKFASLPGTRFGPATQLYFNTVHSSLFITFLEKLTGINALVCDPHLSAGGLHDIPTGGRFALHLDFNQHPRTHLANRLVFITYLNKDWQPSYGGQLELWDKDTDRCVEKVEPLFGRSVIFEQSSRSLHGHPTPVTAPDERPRRSAAAYFYSNGRDDGDGDDFHTTIITKPVQLHGRDKITGLIKYWTPPALVDIFRYYKRKKQIAKPR